MKHVLFFVLTILVADPPKYPDWPVLPKPSNPMPTPKDNVPVSALEKDQLYVVQSDAAVQLLASPQGIVVITEEAGPLRVRGKFVDGGGKIETRLYEKKQVFLVERVAQGDVELLMVPKGEVVRRTIVDSQLPIPPPKPKPDDPPVVEQSPWGNSPGLRVLVIYPKHGALPAAQQAIVTGKRVRDYLDSHCIKENGEAAYWILKTDEDVTGLSTGWQKAYATLQGDRWVVVGNGSKWEKTAMPANADAMLALLKKYGGD